MPHRALTNKIATLIPYFGVSAMTRYGATTSPGFDPLLEQVFCPLCAGGVAVLVPTTVRTDPIALRAYLERHAVTVFNSTPAMVADVLLKTVTA